MVSPPLFTLLQALTDKMGTADIAKSSNRLLFGIEKLIEQASRNVAVYLNTTISRLYWAIGSYIVTEMQYAPYSEYGQEILATLSQRLTEKFGKGYSYSALTRMIKVAEAYSEEMFATLSQTLSWSHFIELVAIEDTAKRLFYQSFHHLLRKYHNLYLIPFVSNFQ